MFIKKVCFSPNILLVQAVEYCVTGPVGCGTGACCLIPSEILTLSTEGPLVNRAVIHARERYAKMLQLVYRPGRRAAHVFNGVLVTKIIAPLDGIEHVPMPVIREHIGQSCIHTTLGGNGMRARRKHF